MCRSCHYHVVEKCLGVQLIDAAFQETKWVKRSSEPGEAFSPLFSPRGERKYVRGASIRGGRRSARGGVLDSTSSTRDRAQRSIDPPIVCFRRQVGRVEDERADFRLRGVAVSGYFRLRRCLSSRLGSVSRPRSSNRTCGFPASGFPTGFSCQLSQAAAPVAPSAGALRPSCQTQPRRNIDACLAIAPCAAAAKILAPARRHSCPPRGRPACASPS